MTEKLMNLWPICALCLFPLTESKILHRRNTEKAAIQSILNLTDIFSFTCPIFFMWSISLPQSHTYTSFIGISITTFSFLRKMYLTFCYFYSSEISTSQLNGEMRHMVNEWQSLAQEVSLPIVENNHLMGQKSICSWLSQREVHNSYFPELNAPIKEKVEFKCYAKVVQIFLSLQMRVLMSVRLLEQVVTSEICLNAVWKTLISLQIIFFII